jgi:hypothetical protein
MMSSLVPRQLQLMMSSQVTGRPGAASAEMTVAQTCGLAAIAVNSSGSGVCPVATLVDGAWCAHPLIKAQTTTPEKMERARGQQNMLAPDD